MAAALLPITITDLDQEVAIEVFQDLMEMVLQGMLEDQVDRVLQIQTAKQVKAMHQIITQEDLPVIKDQLVIMLEEATLRKEHKVVDRPETKITHLNNLKELK